jgi:hypothetical protein
MSVRRRQSGSNRRRAISPAASFGPPLRPYDGDQGGSYRPSFGCNVMGCD